MYSDKIEFEHCTFPHESDRHTNDFLVKQFTSIDKSNDGRLSRQELEESPIFKGFKKEDIEDDLKFEKWDTDGDEYVSSDEFKTFMRILMESKRRIKAGSIFNHVDSNGDEMFQIDEFLDNANVLSKSALTKFGTMFHDEL